MGKEKRLEDMTVEELNNELEYIKECLRDEEETFDYTFTKTSLHIGALQAQSLREGYELKCQEYREKIRRIEELLRRADV